MNENPPDPAPTELPSYKPSVFYFRRALRETDDPEKLRETGLTLCRELELQKDFIRAHGLIPPKENVMSSEAEEKGWTVEEEAERSG